MCSQGKAEYSTERQAYRAARESGFKDVVAYEHDGHWHITRSKPVPHKHQTPKGRGAKPYVPSAAKLRRKLENCGRELRAAERAFKRVEELRKLAEQSKAAYQEELAAIAVMVGRLHRV